MTRTASNAIPFSATFWSIRGCGWPVSLNRHPLQVQADEMLWCVKERTVRALRAIGSASGKRPAPLSTRPCVTGHGVTPQASATGLVRAQLNPEAPGGADLEGRWHELYCDEPDCGCHCLGDCADPFDPCTDEKLMFLKLIGVRDVEGWVTRYGELLQDRYSDERWLADHGPRK